VDYGKEREINRHFSAWKNVQVLDDRRSCDTNYARKGTPVKPLASFIFPTFLGAKEQENFQVM
jgi:hypothetical protein